MRRRLYLVLLLVVSAASATTSWIIAQHVKSPADVAADAAPPAETVLTEQVEVRTLQRTIVTRGHVQAAGTTGLDVLPPEGTSIPLITAASGAVGAGVNEGDRVLEVSGRPLFVMSGAIPMYRDLLGGEVGADVVQLQEALGRLGFRTRGDAAGVYGARTQAAVQAFYESRGYEPLTLSSPATDPLAPPVVSVRIPQTEISFVPVLPATVSVASPPIGTRLDAVEGDIVELAVGSLIVTTALAPDEFEEAPVGSPVSVDLGDGSPAVTGSLSVVSPTATTSEQGGLQHLAQVQLQNAPPSLLGRDVRVTITGASTDQPVMVVPLSAIGTRADGGAVVVVVEGDDQHEVRVEMGMSADGYVEISPAGAARDLNAGDDVLIGPG